MEDRTYLKFIARGIQREATGVFSALALIEGGFHTRWVANNHMLCRPLYRRSYKHGALVLSWPHFLIPDNAVVRMVAPNLIVSVVDMEALVAWIGKVEPDFFA